MILLGPRADGDATAPAVWLGPRVDGDTLALPKKENLESGMANVKSEMGNPKPGIERRGCSQTSSNRDSSN